LLNAATAIEHSSNTFMSAMIGNQLYFKKQNGMDIFASYLKKFGIGVPTGSGLPREYGDDKQLEFYANSKKDSVQSALVYASWGQNEKVTTLQLAQYAAALANKGKRLKPIFVDKITTYDGETIGKPETEVLDHTLPRREHRRSRSAAKTSTMRCSSPSRRSKIHGSPLPSFFPRAASVHGAPHRSRAKFSTRTIRRSGSTACRKARRHRQEPPYRRPRPASKANRAKCCCQLYPLQFTIANKGGGAWTRSRVFFTQS
jgi:hypothetical protein